MPSYKFLIELVFKGDFAEEKMIDFDLLFGRSSAHQSILTLEYLD